jgi:hypothetical protein
MSKDKQRSKLKKAIQKQRNLKLITSKASPNVKVIPTPPISHMDAPDGFRAVSHNQAFQEFTSPIMERLDGEDMDSINKGFQLSLLL